MTTNEFAEQIGIQPQSIHRRVCTTGSYFGIRPQGRSELGDQLSDPFGQGPGLPGSSIAAIQTLQADARGGRR